jgi:4-amino-4-deoxy-L-arabinose transferase-like glycosyltransferase
MPVAEHSAKDSEKGIPKAERFFAPLLLGLSAALFLLNLSGRDLWEPNEPIAAQAAWEMSQRGDWLIPTVNGEVYPDKPPLLFWGIRLAALPRGVIDETTARIPSALAGIGLVLALYFLSRRYLGARGAFLAALSLAVSSFIVEQARYAQHDMLLVLGLTVGTLALFRIGDAESPARGWMALAAVSLAFGVLAKGPVALALPALIVVADTFCERRLLRRWAPMMLAGALALVPLLLYYLILVKMGRGDLVRTFLGKHNVERFMKGFDHRHAWWFFLARSPVDLLPVSLFLPAAALLRPEQSERRRFVRRMWIWILVLLVFFSFSASKRPVYMLPALPAAAALCGAVLEAAAGKELRPRSLKLAIYAEAAALGAMGLAGAVAPVLAARRAPEFLAAALLLAICAVAGSLFGLTRLAKGKILAAHGSLVAALALIWIVAIYRVYPEANRMNSPRTFAAVIDSHVPREAPLATYGLYRFRSGYLFYAKRMMPRLPDPPALEGYLNRETQVYCLITKEAYDRLLEKSDLPHYPLAEGGAGSRREVLISNRPTPADPHPTSLN